ncbi:MAG: glycosyltransferase family 39 protein [Planctomycetes bacterium]|nr:glycosyltransferase family 39 protein [Planctomycetota bacterium]
MWQGRRPILYLLFLSLIVHAGVVLAVYHSAGSIDAYAFNSLDSHEYYQIAKNVATHGVFSQSIEPPLVPDTWRTPGYSLFLAIGMLLGCDSPSSLVIVQQLLSVLNVLLFFLVTRLSMSPPRATIAAALFLLEPYHLYYSLWLMATTLFVTVLLLAWYAWQTALARRGCIWWVGLGMLCGLLVIIRPVGILVPAVVLAGLAWCMVARRGRGPAPNSRRLSWVHLVVYALANAAVLMPWTVRNQIVAGNFALSDQGGVVLAYFKATEVVLWRAGRTADRYLETSLNPADANAPHPVWEAIDAQLRQALPGLTPAQAAELRWANLAQGNKTSVDSFEISRALGRIGWSYLAAAPLSTVACGLTRCASILTFPLNLAFDPPSDRPVNRGRALLLAGPYVVLVGGVLFALVRRRASFVGAFYPLGVVLALLLATTPQIDPRFRVPLIPMLVFVALLPSMRAESNTATRERTC